jgi:hypothetical protein
MHFTNNPMTVGILTGLSFVAAAGSSTSAGAATINDSAMFSIDDSQMVTDDGTQPPTSIQNTVDQLIQLNQFDPSLGTLTGVTFNLTSNLGNTTGLSLLVNNQEFGSDGSASADFTLTIDDSISGSLFDQTFMHSASCTDGSTFCTDNDNTYASASFDDTLNTAVLAGYQGLGTYNVTVSQLIELSATSAGGADSGDAEATFIGDWQGDLEVVYTYDEVVVPLPAAVWLFGSGMVGLLGVAKRKL